MPTALLRTLAGKKLPVKLEDQQSIACAHVLRAANLVEAEIVYADDPNLYLFAVVYRISAEGKAMLQRFNAEDPFQ